MNLTTDTLRPRQNGHQFPDDIFKCIFLHENIEIPVKISRVQLTKFQHWFRWWLGAEQAPSLYLNHWWPVLLMHIYFTQPQGVNPLRPRQNGRHFADDTFKRIFVNENVRISIKISLKFVPKCPIDNIPALFQIMAWRRPGDKPLYEPMMVSLLTHVCVIWPQWVKNMVCSAVSPGLRMGVCASFWAEAPGVVPWLHLGTRLWLVQSRSPTKALIYVPLIFTMPGHPFLILLEYTCITLTGTFWSVLWVFDRKMWSRSLYVFNAEYSKTNFRENRFIIRFTNNITYKTVTT